MYKVYRCVLYTHSPLLLHPYYLFLLFTLPLPSGSPQFTHFYSIYHYGKPSAAQLYNLKPPRFNCSGTCTAQLAPQAFGKTWPPEPRHMRKEVLAACQTHLFKVVQKSLSLTPFCEYETLKSETSRSLIIRKIQDLRRCYQIG